MLHLGNSENATQQHDTRIRGTHSVANYTQSFWCVCARVTANAKPHASIYQFIIHCDVEVRGICLLRNQHRSLHNCATTTISQQTWHKPVPTIIIRLVFEQSEHHRNRSGRQTINEATSMWWHGIVHCERWRERNGTEWMCWHRQQKWINYTKQ